MADKTYKMQVTLTDNRVLDAGTFVAPQGPQGPQGPKGESGGGSVQCFFLSTEGNGGPYTIISPSGNTTGYTKRVKTGALTAFNSFTSVEFEEDVEYTFFINNATGKHIYINDSGGESFVDYVAQKQNIFVYVLMSYYDSESTVKGGIAIFYALD